MDHYVITKLDASLEYCGALLEEVNVFGKETAETSTVLWLEKALAGNVTDA
jgi:hypothetical protein